MTALIIANIYSIPASATWNKDSENNWKWSEGKVKAIGWKEIDKGWYYFNTDEIMKTGWLKYDQKWYNLSSNGAMDIGWKKINEKWYHFNDDGIMSSGWINDNGTWYFTNSSGEMTTGTLRIDGKDYTFSDSGAMLDDKGTIQEIQNESEDVSNIKSATNNSDSRIGYVSTNSDSLNIRLEASTSSSTIGKLAKGAEMKIIDDEKNGFYHINTNGIDGWVSSKWVSFKNPVTTTQITEPNSNINMTKPPIDDTENDNTEKLEDDSLGKGIIRDAQPTLDNKHYYSDMNLFYKVRLSPPFLSQGKTIKGNCTWYAWGRAWEITGKQPNDAGFIGNAYEWWEANKKSGKYQYGSEPRVGAIAVWNSDLPSSGGCGHVAVIEKINDGKIYISESTWHGVTFNYREIYQTSYLDGYIYLDKPNY